VSTGVMQPSDLAELQAPRAYPAVSVLTPMQRRRPGNAEDPIFLRDLADEVARRVRGELGTRADLLTPEEALDRAKVFDIELLADPLHAVARWLHEQPETVGLGVGYFGASTGAAAALSAAAGDVTLRAVVSRGGRPDLAMARLADVHAPTLLIVGGDDAAVLELNRRAASRMLCEHRVEVVPGATHLFEEPGALETVAQLARDWFVDHLTAVRSQAQQVNDG
jgi:putative phosphoribosyl transferase